MPRFHVRPFEWNGIACVAAGTGYTGEDGVEVAVPAANGAAVAFWDAVLTAGVMPAGLGARDTLRLEAGLPLHGHELGPGITPLQAGLGWVIGWDKEDFQGRAALEAERATGPARRLRGIVTESRQPPREGLSVLHGGEELGLMTSGNFSPMLGLGIGLALLKTGEHEVANGDAVTISVRGRELEAHVSRPPFWPPRPGEAGSTNVTTVKRG